MVTGQHSCDCVAGFINDGWPVGSIEACDVTQSDYGRRLKIPGLRHRDLDHLFSNACPGVILGSSICTDLLFCEGICTTLELGTGVGTQGRQGSENCCMKGGNTRDVDFQGLGSTKPSDATGTSVVLQQICFFRDYSLKRQTHV